MFGQNALTIVQENAQPLVLLALIIIGVYFGLTRKFTQLFATLGVGFIAVLFVFNPMGVKDVMLEIGNKLIGR